MTKNAKKNIIGGILILLMLSGLAVSHYWKQYEFRRWVCNNLPFKRCSYLGNILDELWKKEYGEWGKNNPGKVL